MLKRFAGVLAVSFILWSGEPAFGQCPGDCRSDGAVTVDELITAVNIALGTSAVTQCLVADINGDDVITVNELITAVNNALSGCPGSQPTATRTPTAAVTPTTGLVSAELLGVWSGIAFETFTQSPRTVRVRIEVVGGSVVVTDLSGNLFVGRSSLTATPLTPTSIQFDMTTSTHSEVLNVGIINQRLNGNYANITLAIPPTGVSFSLDLTKEA